MPETPTKTVVSAKGKQILINGTPAKLKLFGAYFIWERNLSKEYLSNFFKWLKSYGFNGLRIFAHSTFARNELEAVNVPTWQIYARGANGKYDLDLMNGTWLYYVQQFCYLAAQHGLVVQVVLSDICGFKAGSDIYGWNTNPWNTKNNVNGQYTYDGNAYFKYYHIDRQDKYPKMEQRWEKITRELVNALNPLKNVVFEIGNELAQEEAHEPYGHLQNFMNKLMAWTASQIYPSRPAVFSNSDEKAYFAAKMNIQWSHTHFVEGNIYDGYSTDGYRAEHIGSPENFKNILTNLWNKGKHLEIHLAFFSNLQGVDKEGISALTWFGKKAVDPSTDWAWMEPWIEVMKGLK